MHSIPRSACLAEQPIDRLEGTVLGFRVEGVGAAIERECALALALTLEELARALRQARGRRLVGRDLRELSSEDLGEARLRVRDARQPLELAPRRLVGRILGQQQRRGLERRAVVLFLLLVHLPQAPEQLPPLFGVLAGREASLERRHDAPPIQPRQVDGLEHLRRPRAVIGVRHQRLERGDGLRVLRIDRERRGVLVERALHFLRSLLEDLTQRVMKGGLAFARRTRSFDLALVEGHEVVPALRPSVEPLERRDGLRLEAYVEYLLVYGDGRTGVTEPFVAEVRLLEQQLHPRRFILRRFASPLHHVEQGRVVAGLLVKGLQRGQGPRIVACSSRARA